MATKRFRKKQDPVYVEAMQVTDRNGAEVEAWCGGESYDVGMAPGQTHHVDVPTAAGRGYAKVNDFVVRADDGRFWVLGPATFAAHYEPANQDRYTLDRVTEGGRLLSTQLESVAERIARVPVQIEDASICAQAATLLRKLAAPTQQPAVDLEVTRTDPLVGEYVEVELVALAQLRAALVYAAGQLRVADDPSEAEAYVRSGMEELLAGPLMTRIALLSDSKEKGAGK